MRVSRDVQVKGTDLMAKGPHKIEYETIDGNNISEVLTSCRKRK